MTPIFNFCPIAPACARLSYVAIVVHGSNSSFAVFHSGLRLVFPPVQSKIASFSSLTLRSQRRSSIVAPAVLLVASPWAHSGLRVLLLWVSRAFALDYPTSQSQCTGQTHRLPFFTPAGAFMLELVLRLLRELQERQRGVCLFLLFLFLLI